MDLDGVWVTPGMIPELCRLTGRHRTTVARWLKCRRLPAAVHRLLRIYQGDLGGISTAWDGWRLSPRDGRLYPPGERRGFTPGHLYAAGWRAHQLAALERELAAGRLDRRASVRDAADAAVNDAEFAIMVRNALP